VVGMILIDASNIYKGVIIKILIFVALIKAVRDARKYEEVKATMGLGER
jgi:hypothetical protein